MKPSGQLDPKDLAHTFLLSYAAYQFPGYQIAPHHKMVASHLEAVERGDIKRLMIFMPPRHGKSMLASEFFPAWYLGRNPEKQIIAATYSFDRAGDTGRKVRNQVADPVHTQIFDYCSVSRDSKGANKLSTEQGGNMFSVGIGGAITGRGADVFLIDDPVKGREDADSETAQRKLREWFSSVAYTRLMPGGAIILIMTRWSYYDLAGWLLDEKSHENWQVLSLPAISEGDDDLLERPRGHPLWPSFYSLKTLRNIKTTLGTREWNALYQQRPLPEEGGMVKQEWFKRYEYRDYKSMIEVAANQGRKFDIRKARFPFRQIVCSWDTAFKESEINDPSACTVWGVTDTDAYLLWSQAKRLDFPALRAEAIAVHQTNRRHFNLSPAQVPLLIEDKASGQSLIQELKKTTRIPIIPIKADANKQVRMSEVTAMIEAGKVWLPDRATWLVDYETELCEFPYSKFDDQADSTSQFLRWWGRPRYVRSRKKLYYK